jgi:hypothetical protein
VDVDVLGWGLGGNLGVLEVVLEQSRSVILARQIQGAIIVAVGSFVSDVALLKHVHVDLVLLVLDGALLGLVLALPLGGSGVAETDIDLVFIVEALSTVGEVRKVRLWPVIALTAALDGGGHQGGQ